MRILLTIFGLLLLAAGAIPGAAGVLGFSFSLLQHNTSYAGPSALMLVIGLAASGAGVGILLHNMQRMSFNGTKVFVGGFFALGAAFFSWVFVTNLNMAPFGLLLFAGLAIGFAAMAVSFIRQEQNLLAA
ncbi:hypothetical protein BH11PAT2_BH11PAT2_09840 [soil metagenome]